LDDLVTAERFRHDLMYRVNAIHINAPSLRERIDDIPLLVSHYLKKISISNDKSIKGVSSPALQVLEHYNWPGNVRQLVNSLEHAAITCKTDTVEVSDLPDYLFEEDIAEKNKPLAEKEKIRDALTMFKGNRTLAAKHLGISRVTLWKRIKDYNITV